MDCILARRRFAGVLASFCLAFAFTGCGGGGGGSTASSSLTESPGTDDPTFIDDRDFVDYSRAVGFYTGGSVAGSAKLPDSGAGFLKIFRLRERGYGTETLVRTLVMAAGAWRAEYPRGERVQIGDLGDSNGGYVSGHASHQNGLDVDIAYLNHKHVERDPDTNGPGGYKEKFVSGGKLTANFDVARNWGFIKHLVLRGNTGRIFVDGAIKKAFCAQAATLDPRLPSATRTEILRRLRPYANHADHLHLRLKCPANHPKCKAQSEPSKGSGCSSSAAASLAEYDDRTDEQRSDDELGPDDDAAPESAAE